MNYKKFDLRGEDRYLSIYENSLLESSDLANKIFCTFTEKDTYEKTVADIKSTYTILYGKIFVFESPDMNEFLCTYNVDVNNIKEGYIMDNTILCHRNKSSNTLYTINSLNALIASLNNGVVDHNYIINWNEYRNCILLTRDGSLTRVNTKIHNIIYTDRK